MILEIFLYFQLYFLYVLLHNCICLLLLETLNSDKFQRIIGYRMILFIFIGFPIFLYDLYDYIFGEIKRRRKIKKLRKKLDRENYKLRKWSNLNRNSVFILNHEMRRSQIIREINNLKSKKERKGGHL